MADEVEASDANERSDKKVQLSDIKAAYQEFMLPVDTPDDMMDLLNLLK